MDIGQIFEEISGAVVAMDSTGVKLTFVASSPTRVTRFGVNVHTDAFTGTFSMELQLALFNAAGTLAAAASVGGKSLDATTPNEGTVLFAEPDERVTMKAGDVLTLNVTDAATAGDGFPWIQYQRENWTIEGEKAQFSDATPTNRMVDGSTDL